MTTGIGKRVWAIAEGYIPSQSSGDSKALQSHETVCLLNTNDADAHVRLHIYFTDKDPVGPYEVMVPARRTRHIRFNELEQPQRIPRDTSYACVIESDLPLIAQHTRLDSRQPALAVMTTVAYGDA